MYGILIADDEDIILQGLAHTIDWKSMGFRVVGLAKNGQQALTMIEELKPKVILADIRMPGLSGIELAKKIRENHPEIFMVILSGFDKFEYAKEAIDYNVFSYLLKPYNQEKMAEVFGKIKKILDKTKDVDTVSEIINLTLFKKELAHYMEKLNSTHPPEDIHKHFLSIIDEYVETMGAHTIGASNLIIKRVISIIQFRYMEDLSLDIIADELKVSPSYLSRLFKNETGINFKTYLKEYRINLAKYRLINSSMKIYEIAESVGYRDHTYFSDLFKKAVGCSPLKFKNMNSGID